jgi:hypothetical protein
VIHACVIGAASLLMCVSASDRYTKINDEHQETF